MKWFMGVLAMVPVVASAVGPLPDEMAEARRFVSAAFWGARLPEGSEAFVEVLANHDPVQVDARAGRLLNIAGVTYERGLYCHAVSKLIVHLPSAGAMFEGTAGVDSNEDTKPGRGSVAFSITAGGVERFNTGVMHEGMPGVPFRVELDGAMDIALDISDAGDGISCDQPDWANAEVTLKNGKKLWLGELPLRTHPRKPYPATPPIAFTYGGKPFGFDWPVRRERTTLDSHRTQRTITYTDPATKLEVRIVEVEYDDFPTVEWTAHLKNTGTEDTPLIEGLQALDGQFELGDGGAVLHHNTGSPCTQTDYEPHVFPLGEKRLVAAGGRPSNSDLPYFNVERGGEGVVCAVGWPGQWAATVALRQALGDVAIRAGQELTHLKLHPGEQVRTPLMVLQFYRGDPVRAQNTWRRWMLAHSVPRPGGTLPEPEWAACSSHQFGEMIHADEANQIQFVDRYLEEGLKLDYWWMDAGWYVNDGGWPNTGTWEVDPKRFPRGLRAITDHAHAKGVRSIVWFEPERVTPKTWVYDTHPEWLLGKDGEQKLLNLGNPAAREWLTDHTDGLLKAQGIDLYRQDFNIDPLDYWRQADAPDRQGVTENHYVTGYLTYWDELRHRHPNMLIDSCASGGRRNDLETLRRAVPLLRSDYIFEPIGQQCHTYGIASWFPFYGSGCISMEPYLVRSVLCPGMNSCWDVRRKDLPYDVARKLQADWRKIAPMFFGDYYPLTPYSTSQDVWMAWQFNRPEQGDGFVQAFRRETCIYESARLPLRGLDPSASYRVTDLDRTGSNVLSGRELMEKGLAVAISERPGAVIIVYKRMK